MPDASLLAAGNRLEDGTGPKRIDMSWFNNVSRGRGRRSDEVLPSNSLNAHAENIQFGIFERSDDRSSDHTCSGNRPSFHHTFPGTDTVRTLQYSYQWEPVVAQRGVPQSHVKKAFGSNSSVGRKCYLSNNCVGNLCPRKKSGKASGPASTPHFPHRTAGSRTLGYFKTLKKSQDVPSPRRDG